MISVLKYLPPEISREAEKYIDRALEIRLTAGSAAAITIGDEVIELEGKITAAQLRTALSFICHGAPYSAQSSLKEGYITLEGGHRVGVCGRIASDNMVEPGALCFRIAREIKGAAQDIAPFLGQNILFVSPPGCGKTTILRDAARIAGEKMPVCIVDERSEIAAVYKGVPQMDIGRLSCVLDGVEKSRGMLMALRAMAPKIIVTDEIGGEGDVRALWRCINAGVKIMTSVHGYDENDIKRTPALYELISSGAFEKIVVLKGRGEIKRVIDNA